MKYLPIFAFLVMASCTGALQGGTINLSIGPKPVTYNVACVVSDAATHVPIPNAECNIEGQHALTNGDGYHLFLGVPSGARLFVVSANGYATSEVPFTNDHNQNVAIPLTALMPEPPSREAILAAHESFQGAVLHTEQFGDLFWWPAAWTSLNDADRAASYAQIASWGDTDITVSIAWEYGESSQPYGSGQLVPPTDLTGNLPRFRALVKEVAQHGFVPVVFMAGDNGFNYYMWVMPLVVKALKPQPDDPLDLTPYVKLRMCYDSCVPGWAGDADSKQFISEAIMATRAACPACVIALEFATGFSSQGDGGAFWNSAAGQALDEADWEGNTWPPNNFEQYWEILDRWLGPLYRKPAAQVSDPGAPFGPGKPEWYLGNGTPRGPYGVHCFEPGTYQWIRGQISPSQISDMYQLLAGLGCSAIDMPVPRG